MIRNKKSNILGFAIVFVVLFIIGGIIGFLSLPTFDGRFYISGFLLAVFGTGTGFLYLTNK